jgi:hypothetical protein
VSPTIAYPFVFGDIFSYKTNDAYRCIIIGRNGENTGSAANEGLSTLANGYPFPLTYPIIGHYMAASWTGIGNGIPVGKHIDMVKMGCVTGVAVYGLTGGTALSGVGAGTCALGRIMSNSIALGVLFPNAPDGGMYVSPIWVHHSGYLRGYLKGLWAPCHHLPLNHNDTYSGTGNLAGKSFLSQVINTSDAGGTTPVPGQVHLETSSTWS